MRIGVMGTAQQLASYRKINTAFTEVQDTNSLQNYDIFIDLNFDQNPHRITEFQNTGTTLTLLGAVNIQLENAMAQAGIKYKGQKILGINNIPTFIERSSLEYSNPFEIDISDLELLGYEALEQVDSRVGMVSPRIIFMIINEAYYTLQEGTATKADIDTAMKLGTAYPKGPFEWANEAGLGCVYRTLEAIYKDTHEERYKICPLLKTEYLKQLIK